MKLHHTGLSESEVLTSREMFGSNKITPQEPETFLEKLVGNLKDPTVMILIVALVIISVLAAFGYAHWYEGVGIACAVLVATGVATWSEHKNESAFQSLLDEASKSTAKVVRDGHVQEILVDDLVVGDIVTMMPGDKVPADGVIIEGSLKIDQASLTGESDLIKKVAVSSPEEEKNGDIHSKHHVFRGSIAADGEAVVRITTVGDNSFYGQLAKELEDDDRVSPLTAKLQVLAEKIGKYGTIGAVFIGFAFMFQKLFGERGLTLETILPFVMEAANWPVLLSDLVTAVILAVVIIVVAVPEGLPMMIAIVLSLNMRKLLSGNVLVRKLLGIESAGSMDILFTDKTGTLTKGHLEVSAIITGKGNESMSPDTMSPRIHSSLSAALKNNTLAVIDASDDEVTFIGADRTETALLNFIKGELKDGVTIKPEGIIPFNSERKFSAVHVSGVEHMAYVKGAPELVIAKCTTYLDENQNRVELTDDVLKGLQEKMDKCANASMRLIAVAHKAGFDGFREDLSMPQEMTLIAVVGLRDELRDESFDSVKEAQNAGIQVVMVTGDRLETAVAIAKDVGLMEIPDAVILTSDQLESMSDDEVKEVMPKLRVVARAYPHQKSRLVRLAQEMGRVVGMTGDGVNDAAALKRADVGFAMGSGTEVAKDAGDIVILDDNFSSITRAVLYGRTLFRSIRKFLIFQLTVNVSAILVAFLGPFFGFDLPLTMIQLLWINLVMDTLAALAFSGDAALKRYMKAKPTPREESLISKDMWSSILVNGVAISALSIAFLTSDGVKSLFSSEAAFLTGFFAFFVFIHNFNKFNARTESMNLMEHMLENKGFLPVIGIIFAVQITFTYFGGDMLRTVGLSMTEWLYVLAMSSVIIPIDLLRKFVRDQKKTAKSHIDSPDAVKAA